MYQYIKGKVIDIVKNAIILDNNNIGYLIYTSNPFVYEVNKEYKVFIYTQIKEDEHNLFGFRTIEEKELFLKLIGVKGVGPKMALPILATGSIAGIVDAIERENILYLKKFPKIGDKLAKQIILDLKGKIKIEGLVIAEENSNLTDLIEVLKGLGYKETEFNNIVQKINKELSLEEQIKEALKLMLK